MAFTPSLNSASCVLILLPRLGGGSAGPFSPSVWFTFPRCVIIAWLLPACLLYKSAFESSALLCSSLSLSVSRVHHMVGTSTQTCTEKMKLYLLQARTSSGLFPSNWADIFPLENPAVLLSELLSNSFPNYFFLVNFVSLSCPSPLIPHWPPCLANSI